MNITPIQELHRLSQALFERRMPAAHIHDDTVYALCPSDQSVYRIKPDGHADGTFVVDWIPSGQKKREGRYEAQQDPSGRLALPPPELLQGLGKALPMPSDWAWGVVAGNQIKEMLVFTWPGFDNGTADQRPSSIFVVRQDCQGRNYGSYLYPREWINIKRFWELVLGGGLVCIKPQLGRIKTLRRGTSGGHICIIADDVLLAPPALWKRRDVLTVADLQDVTDMPRP